MNLGFKLDPGEEVLRLIYRHPIDLLPSVIMSAALATTALGLTYVVGRFDLPLPFPPLLLLVLVVLLLGLAAAVFLVGIFVYKRNYLVFTNFHYVQSEQIGLFGHRLSQLSFLKVEDVTGKKAGFWQTIFNFGEVTVQSAGEQEKFIFRNAPNPSAIADEALATHEKCMREAARQGIRNIEA